MYTKNTREGLTLIELLVVVLIVSILAAVALPQYQKAVERSKFTQTLVWLRQIYRAEKMYYLRNGSYDQSLAKLDIMWPKGTKLTPSNTAFGRITLPDGFSFAFNSNNTSIQCIYKGITIQTPLSNGVVDCYFFNDQTKKKICQRIQHAGYTCHVNHCTLISFGK